MLNDLQRFLDTMLGDEFLREGKFLLRGTVIAVSRPQDVEVVDESPFGRIEIADLSDLKVVGELLGSGFFDRKTLRSRLKPGTGGDGKLYGSAFARAPATIGEEFLPAEEFDHRTELLLGL